MRGTVIGVALLTGALAAGPAWAGVYHRREMQAPLPTELSSVLSQRSDLRSVNDQFGPPFSSLHGEYVAEVAKLESRQEKEPLKPLELLDLSACYIRLGRYGKAIELLEPKRKEDDPTRFLLLLNLAAAYWDEKDRRPRALDCQKEALDAWPTHYAGWSWEEWHHYLRAETLLYKLMQDREQAARGGSAPPALDRLFLGVTFARRDGKYEVGGLEPAQAARLPADAEPLVIQLILWQPTDVLLLWDYAELLNARGEVADALRVMDLLVGPERMSNVALLFDHRRALKQAPAAPPKFRFVAAAEPPVTGALPSWQQVGVGFLAGALVASLALLQLGEWRRRAAARARPSAAQKPTPDGPRLPQPPDERVSRPGG
jgi:tetratricopeptide (TPR) repeat protein